MGFEKGNRSKIYVNKLDQMLLTIPRAISEAMGFVNGDFVGWRIGDRCLIVSRYSSKLDTKTCSKVTVNKSGAVVTRIPRKVGLALGVSKGVELYWFLEDGDMVLRLK